MKPRRSLSRILACVAALVPITTWGAFVVTYTPADGGLALNQPITIDGYSEIGAAGAIKVNPAAGNPAGYTSSFMSVCLDVTGALYLNTPTKFTPVSFPDASFVGLNPPWGNNGANGTSAAMAGNALNNAAHLIYNAGSLLASGTLVDRVAVQLAIWEVLYDTGAGTGFDLSSGRFLGGTSQTRTAAQGLLDSLFASNSESAGVEYAGAVLVPIRPDGSWDRSKQELMFDPSSITPVPEASTIFAGIAGLAMLAAIARSQRAQRAGPATA